MSSIAERLAEVRARVAAACARAGRAPESVTLVAVSKLKPAALIREAHAAGQRDFGENYAQELRDKAAELESLEGLRWHAIGPLQTNKVKYVARVAHAFHALDRLEVAQELSRRRLEAPLPCYVEVNVGAEATKSGVRPEATACSVTRRSCSGTLAGAEEDSDMAGDVAQVPGARCPAGVSPWTRWGWRWSWAAGPPASGAGAGSASGCPAPAGPTPAPARRRRARAPPGRWPRRRGR